MFAKIIIAAFACASLVAAQGAAPADTAQKAAPAKKSAAAPSVVKGTVVSVDTVAKTLIIKAKKGEDTLTIDTATVIKAAGKKITLGELKAETSVTAQYKTVEGKKVATKVTETVAAEKPKKDSTAASAPAAK